jgi:tRNA (Thr-GGU) A37 N-methylase
MAADTTIVMQPIGYVRATRAQADDDFWGGQRARIELVDRLPVECLRGLDQFSHAEVVFLFHGVDPAQVIGGARHPRDNAAWPCVGIFAQRGRNRPNRIGTTICRVAGIEGRTLHLLELDAIDGTPVLDVKPVMREFLPRQAVRQPHWSNELMRDYWSVRDGE